ncbi:Wzz/FepE/Etk N-terminal domain-containing protein [Thermosulfuriphilus sp.]
MEDKRVSPPEIPSFYEEDEIDLAELFGVLWKRRWFIVGVVFVSLLAAGLYCVFVPSQYKISMQLRPGVTGFNEKGNPISDWTVNDLKAWVDEGAYLGYLLEEFKDGQHIPKIEARVVRNGTLVTLSMFQFKDKRF